MTRPRPGCRVFGRVAVVGLAFLLAGCTSFAPTPDSNTSGATSGSGEAIPPNLLCPGHFHATFGVFVPSPRSNDPASDAAQRIDWASPQTASGAAYYDYGTDPHLNASVHLHQRGPEQGNSALGPQQFHFEGGPCIGIRRAFAAIDLDVTATSMQVRAGTPLSTTNPTGPWQVAGDARLRLFVQERNATGAWAWAEHDVVPYLGYQLRDGDAMVLAFGHYSDEAIRQMEDAIPPPVSRQA